VTRKIDLDVLPDPREPLGLWRGADQNEVELGTEVADERLDDGLAVFTEVRPRLFGIAYRMLGSVADAEDLVQEVWVRWQQYDRASVREPAAFLATTTTRMAINELQSARLRRETYVGPWLPEPIATGTDPELSAEDDETLQLAVLFLLERATPAERAAYVLHEAFAYPYSEIATIIDTTEANARQLARRARRRLDSPRRTQVGPAEQRRFLAAFIEAARSGEVERLESLLAEDIVLYADGGGVGNASRIPVEGAARVARFVAAFSVWLWDLVEVRWVEANGLTAAVLVYEGVPYAMFTVTATEDGIDGQYWMMNPAKLGGVFFLMD